LHREYKLDLLRTISIILVLIWHLKPFEIYTGSEERFLALLTINVINIFLFQIVFLAVPLFFLVSLYLIFKKSDQNVEYFLYRTRRIFILFVFWFLAQIMMHCLLTKTLPEFSLKLISNGGPDLPMPAGESVFYYLFDLLVLIFLCYLFIRPKMFKQIVGWSIILFSFAYFEISLIYGWDTNFRGLENFILYIPLAYSLNKNSERMCYYRYYIFAFFVLFSVHDMVLYYHFKRFLPYYGRISVVFGSLSIWTFLFSYRYRENSIVKIISCYSLGIFAMHKYWFYFIYVMSDNLVIKTTCLMITFNSGRLIMFVLAVILTLLSAYILSKTPLRSFVS